MGLCVGFSFCLNIVAPCSTHHILILKDVNMSSISCSFAYEDKIFVVFWCLTCFRSEARALKASQLQ